MSSAAISDINQINFQNVYQLLYQKGPLTQQDICRLANISRPTATQYLRQLLQANKIYAGGKHKEAHGRPACLYCFNPNACISIGVEVMVNKVKIAAVNLLGEIEKRETIHLAFINSDSYFQHASSWIKLFMDSLDMPFENILGLTISFQGIVSRDNEHVSFSKLLTNAPFSKSDFSKYFDSPVSLVHDAEMGAVAEIWHYCQITNGIYLSLNPYLGSGLIVNRTVVHTPDLSSGAIEHMILHENGELCYCGKKGCADSYCSVNALERSAGKGIDALFDGIKSGFSEDKRVWENYLWELAALIDNVRMVLPGDVILGGLLSQYMCEEDTARLKSMVQQLSAFKDAPFDIYIGHYGSDASLVGSALMKISEYCQKEGLKA